MEKKIIGIFAGGYSNVMYLNGVSKPNSIAIKISAIINKMMRNDFANHLNLTLKYLQYSISRDSSFSPSVCLFTIYSFIKNSTKDWLIHITILIENTYTLSMIVKRE
jgi:hypothetical protein